MARPSRHKLRIGSKLAAGARAVCDRGRVLQMFSNLVGNAIKFSPAHTQVVIDASLDGEEIRFDVRDEGSGIEPEHLPKLFQRYWQSNRSGQSGMGIGLSIARGLVEAHGGRLWAESTPEKGSTFSFTLKCTQTEERETTISEERSRPLPH